MALKSVMLGVVTGLVIGISLSELPSLGVRAPSRARLVSDSEGALAELCIHYRRDFHDACADLYTDLVKALAPGTIIHVVTGTQEEFDFFEKAMASPGLPAGVRLLPVITGFEITPWAKDRFGTMRTDDGGAVLAIPPASTPMRGTRGNDGRVPHLLAARLNHVTLRPLPFFFDGGDLLADSKVAYVAPNCLARNQPEDIDNRTALLQRIGTTLDRRIVTLGRRSGDLPDHHIGMYLTPLGNGVVAVGDPDLGRAILDRTANGQLEQQFDIQRASDACTPFRYVIAQLEAAGIEVIRVPMLLTKTPRVYVTYNNAILEQRAGEKRIYMPVYDLPALDAEATRVFEQQGWKVFPIRVGKVYQHTGSLRCLVGIIRRSDDGEVHD